MSRLARKAFPRLDVTSRSALAVLLMSAPAIADTTVADPGAAPAWREEDEARRMLAPWRRCAALRQEIPFVDDEDHLNGRLAARLSPEGAEAFVYSEGSGRWGTGDYTTLRLTRGRCDAQGWHHFGLKEWLDTELVPVGVGEAAKPSLQEVASWTKAVLVDDPARADLAAARVLVQLWDADDRGPRRRTPLPEHAGRPRGSPVSIWTRATLRAAGFAEPVLPESEAVFVGPVREPRLLEATTRWEIWELRFRARNGGGLIAVYDRPRDRHRWVWATHGDWAGRHHGTPSDAASFQIVGLDEKVVVIWISFESDNTLLAIDLERGVARESAGERGLTYDRDSKGVATVDARGFTIRVLPLSSFRR